MSNVYRPFKIGGEWSIIDQYGGILYDAGAGFKTPTEAKFVADFHNQHPDAEWERDVMPAFNARFIPPASEPAVDADTELLQWLQSQPKGKLMSMSLDYLAQLALGGDKASAPVDAGEGGVYPGNSKSGFVKTMPLEDYDALTRERDDLRELLEATEESEEQFRQEVISLSSEISGYRNQAAAAYRRERQTRDEWGSTFDLYLDLKVAGEKVVQDCEACGVEPFSLQEFKEVLKRTPPPAPDVGAVSALVEACKPFVELWRKWVVYSTDENCADSELSFWQWFLQGSTNPDIKAEHIRKLAAAAALAEQGGEGENS